MDGEPLIYVRHAAPGEPILLMEGNCRLRTFSHVEALALARELSVAAARNIGFARFTGENGGE